MAQLFANNAFGSLGATLSAVATSLTLATGQGARFPTPTGGDHFLLTLIGLDGNGNENAWEIVKVTARSADTLTVVRSQESTTAALWAAGARVEMRATKGTFDGLLQLLGGTVTGPVSVVSGAYTALKVGITGLVSVGGEAGSAEAKFTVTDAGNVGMEFSPTAIAGANRLLSYNRASMQFAPMTLMALSHKLNVSGTDMLTVDSTGMTYTGTLTGGTGVVNIGSGQLYKDASGNLGIGSAPGATSGRSIDLNGVALQPLYILRASSLTSATAQWTLNSANSTVDFISSDFGTRWIKGATTQMTLDASGNLLVGTTTPASAEKFGVASSTVSGQVEYLYASSASFDGTVQVLNSARSATTGYYFTRAFANGSVVYGVFGNGNVVNTNNSYGAISDLKLKDNIVDVTPKLAKLLQVRIVNYTLKADPNKTKLMGVIAQELEQISPGLIEETPDYEEVTRTREVTKTVPVTEKAPVLREQKAVEVVDGKAIVKTQWVEELADVPVVDHYPLFDADGQPVLEMVTPEVPAVTDADGNVTQPAVAATYRQAMHSVPRMKEVTETETYTERVPTGTTTKSVKYSVFVPMLIKGIQEQQAQIDAQNTAMQLLEDRLAALEAK